MAMTAGKLGLPGRAGRATQVWPGSKQTPVSP